MIYYEVKAVIKDEEGKMKTKQFVAKSESVILADALVATNTSCERITNVNEKNWVDVFNDDAKEFFYELKTEVLDLEGKTRTELYLQKADSTKEAEDLLFANITHRPDIKGIKETKIVASY